VEPSFESSAQAPQAMTQSIEYQNHLAFAVEEVGNGISKPGETAAVSAEAPARPRYAA